MAIKIIRRKLIENIEDQAMRIVEEYAYMDKLPLEGWAWEMIRRGQDYPRLVDECLRDRKGIHTNPKYKSAERALIKRKLFMRSWEKKFAAIGLDVMFDEGEHSKDHYRVVKFRDHYETNYLALPDFEKKYIEFNIKPSIIGTRSVKHVEYSTIAEWQTTVEDWEAPDTDIGAIDELLHMLSPVKFEDTLYLGISRVGKKNEILTQISGIIDKFAKPTKKRLRTDKWKNYLIVYDLVENKKYQYSKVADIMCQASSRPGFSKKAIFDEDNVKDFHEAAQRLIDSVGYKKYLSI
jgi:hypothetical protein